jgi:PAS domain S-box-containing protein
MPEATLALSVPAVASIPEVLQAPPEFLEKLPLAIYACDTEGRILWFNGCAAELWGRAPRIGDDAERYCGSYKLYFYGRRISREETPMASVLRTGIPIKGVEGRVERPDGTTIWAMVHIEPVKDGVGGIAGAINCFHETTALHHAEDEFDDIFEDSAAGLTLISPNGTILRADRAELQMLGHTADEYVGKNISDFHLDRAAIENVISRLRLGEQPIEYPARLRAKDGSIRDVRITFSVRRRNGKLVNARCFTVARLERGRPPQAARDSVSDRGIVSVPKPGQDVCGDSGQIETMDGMDGQCIMLVADGLGHGPEAANAAVQAVRVFQRHKGHQVATLLDYIHGGLRATRGAAVSVARIDRHAGKVVFAGIGNVAGVVVTAESERRMISLPGRAGHNVRKIQAYEYPFHDGLVILHSDGLGTAWSLAGYPGLSGAQPALIAAVLYRDFSRKRDDCTIVVVREKG